MSKSARTKQFIITQTAPIFNAKGFAGTSMSDLTEATGLTKGSIYGNFENKDAVALAAFDYNFEQIFLYLRNKMDARPKIIDKLLVYPETYRGFLNLPILKAGCPILNTATEADDTHPMLKIKAQNALSFWKKAVEKTIQTGIETHEIKASVNPGEFSVVLMSLIEGAVMQAKVTDKSDVLHVTMDFLEKMILDLKAS